MSLVHQQSARLDYIYKTASHKRLPVNVVAPAEPSDMHSLGAVVIVNASPLLPALPVLQLLPALPRLLMFLHLCHLHPRKSSCIASLWFINSLHALIRAPAPPFHHDSTNEGCRTHHTAVALLLGRIAPGAPTGGVAFLLAALPALSGLAGSWFSFAGSSPSAPPLGAASAPRRPWAQRLWARRHPRLRAQPRPGVWQLSSARRRGGSKQQATGQQMER